jgi:hypothetical protein
MGLIKCISMMSILVGFFLRLLIIFRTEYTSIPVATLWSCSLYFVCSLFWLLQWHEFFLKKITMLWKTWLLLSESIFSVRSNTLVFKCYILLDIQVVVIVKHVLYTIGLSSLSYFLLLFLCRPMRLLVQPLLYETMAAVVSSLCRNHGASAFLDLFNKFFFENAEDICASFHWRVTNLLWWALLQP